MATTDANLSCFSDDSQHLAYSSTDGTLRIFECATGKLKQEYSSSSHLSAVTSALSWRRNRRETVSTPKSKRKRTNSTSQGDKTTEIDALNLIALGTTSGSVLLYSFAKGSLHTQLVDGHSSKVTGVCWHLTAPELFTCSKDQHVAQWDLHKGKVKYKWKCDSSAIYSVCQCSENRLLTASHSIKLWDLDNRTLLQTLTGHSSPVFCLQPVWTTSDNEASYVLSAAMDDRHVNVWSCDESSKTRSSIASFSVPDEPTALSIAENNSNSQALILAVITRKGALHIFHHVLNGAKKKPIRSQSTVNAVVTDGTGDDKEATPVSILACSVNNTKHLTVAFGNPIKPDFEAVVYDPSKAVITLSVQAPVKSLTKEEYSQVKKPEVSDHMTTLIPTDSQPIQATRNKAKKRSRKSSVSDLTVEERLNAMGTDTPKESYGERKPPLANTMSRMLQQGLLSGDRKILASVFQERNDTVVRNTLKRLPVTFIVPLVKEIDKGMNGHAQSACNYSRWTAALISIHTSYILSVPEIVNTMNKLYQTLISRQKFYPKMLQLKGRLQLVKQDTKSSDVDEEEDKSAQPLLVFQDESDSDSDDSMVVDGGTAAAESDENWDDLSDMET